MSHLSALKGIDSPLSKSDHFFTPAALLVQLHDEFRFTLDVASHPLAPSNQIIGRALCWPERDGLKESWAGERVWCNPPYSDIKPWVERAFAAVTFGCPLVAMLLPANKTEQPWWQIFIEPFRDQKSALSLTFSVETRFLARRIKFASPDDLDAKRGSGTFGSMLVIWRAL